MRDLKKAGVKAVAQVKANFRKAGQGFAANHVQQG